MLKHLYKKSLLLSLITGLSFTSSAQQPTQAINSKGYGAHDPVMIKQDSTFYLFVTGGGMAKSTDLENWTRIKPVPANLEWVTDSIIPGYRSGF